MERIDARKIHRNRVIISLLAVITGFVMVVAFYFVSDYSRVYRVAVFGNEYLDDAYIKELAKVKEGDVFYLVGLNKAADRVRKSPFIKDVRVSRSAENCITIDVVETKIYGYIYDEYPAFMTTSAEEIEMDDEMVYLISYFPYISEIEDKEVLSEVSKAFEKLDNRIIKEISEIRTFPFSYDENTLELVMRDGNYLYVSKSGLKAIENYHLIVSNLETNRKCIFFEDVTNTAYTSDCPRIKIEKPIINPDSGTNEQNSVN